MRGAGAAAAKCSSWVAAASSTKPEEARVAAMVSSDRAVVRLLGEASGFTQAARASHGARARDRAAYACARGRGR